jgi:hypothetical protein
MVVLAQRIAAWTLVAVFFVPFGIEVSDVSDRITAALHPTFEAIVGMSVFFVGASATLFMAVFALVSVSRGLSLRFFRCDPFGLPRLAVFAEAESAHRA